MKIEDGRESDNIEDRRNSSGGSGGNISGILGLLTTPKGIGMVVLSLGISYFFGINPITILSFMTGGSTGGNEQFQNTNTTRTKDKESKLVAVVLADTEDVWNSLFKNMGKNYEEPKLVLFRGTTPTACGQGKSAMGPFYCSGDKKVYIDLSFFDELKSKFKAPGDFAQAYVVAHEVGHHVQNLLGISGKVHRKQRSLSESESNALSVKLELQADCFAGAWGFHANKAKNILESGDLEEALNAASQIGDDTLQKNSGGSIVPESFTHGSSAQRMEWFKKGIESGDIENCNTFK